MDSFFSDLPAALVDDIISKSEAVGLEIIHKFRELNEKRKQRRDQVEAEGLLQRENDFPYATPTSCGVDGAYGIEQLLATDLIVSAAVAMEGLTPPSETRYWPDPKHHTHVAAEPHDPSTTSILRGITIGNEYRLAVQGPHDVVFIDGSFTTGVIYFNQALNQLSSTNTSQLFIDNASEYLQNYLEAIKSDRSDKQYAAVPKYTSRREIGKLLGWPESYDDRAMLTDVLQAGELTKPILLENPKSPWHLNARPLRDDVTVKCSKEIAQRLKNVYVVYYRPNSALPALRVEVPFNIANNPSRLSQVIYALKHQCTSPAILEPYPLYMADRMVKSLSGAIPAFRQILTQQVAENYDGNLSDIFLNLHSYRTESGR